MCTHKSKKISEVINKSDEDLNLHEIKAKTGAGNGLSSTNTTPSEMIDNNNPTHKSHKLKLKLVLEVVINILLFHLMIMYQKSNIKVIISMM